MSPRRTRESAVNQKPESAHNSRQGVSGREKSYSELPRKWLNMASSTPTRLASVFRAVFSRPALPAHAAVVLAGLSVGYCFSHGSYIFTLLLTGIPTVYGLWFITSLVLTSPHDDGAERVVRADGLSYGVLALAPLPSLLGIAWFTISSNLIAALLFALTLLLLLKMPLLRQDISRFTTWSARRGSPWAWATGILAATYAVVFSIMSYQEYASFTYNTSYYDLAHFSQAAWNTLQGRFLEFTFSDGHVGYPMSRLGLHVDPIIALWSIFYLINDSPVTLLVIQSVVIAAATWPLYLLSMRLLRNPFLSFCVCLAYLLHPGIQYGNLSQFHAVSAAPLGLVALFYALETRRWKILLPALLFTFLCKEHLPLTVFGIGLWSLVRKGDKRMGWALCVLSVLWFVACQKWIIPHYLAGKQTVYLEMFYEKAGGSFQGIAARFISDPVDSVAHLLTKSKLFYLDSLFFQVGYLPLIVPSTLLFSGPELLVNTLSDFPHMHVLTEHYNFVTATCLIVAAVYALSGILRTRESALKTAQRYGDGSVQVGNVAVALAFLVLLPTQLSHRVGFAPWANTYREILSWKPPQHALASERILRQIPPEASVTASSILMGHLAHRRTLYVTPYLGDAEYAIVDISEVELPHGKARQDYELMAWLRGEGNYTLKSEAEGIFLWQRKPYASPVAPKVNFDFQDGFTVVAPKETQSDAAVKLGVSALSGAVGRALDFASAEKALENPSALQGPALVLLKVGNPEFSTEAMEIVQLWERTKAVPESAEGYLLRTREHLGHPCLFVVSKSELGLAYGLFHIADELKETLTAKDRSWNATREPALSLRLMSTPFMKDKFYDNPETALRYGFNAVMIDPWPALITYHDFDHRIYGEKRNQAAFASLQYRRQEVRKTIQRTKSLHLRVVAMGDVFSFPKSLYQIYGSRIRHVNVSRFSDQEFTVCAGQSLPYKILQQGLDELLREVPGIDYVMVRTGENYPTGLTTGSGPSSGRCRLCRGVDYSAALTKTINTIHAIVVGKHHRQYIHRAWDLGRGGFHANPNIYEKITRGIVPSNDVTVSLKMTETDFWRFNPLNPNIGRGPLKQMVEFQCAREYEGKGAFPNYLGELFCRGAPETHPQRGLLYATSVGVESGWAWARGGGWGGPYLKSRIWVDANVHALSRLMWNPFLDPGELAKRWATRTFGAKAAPTVANILLNSPDAVALSRYFSAIAGQPDVWKPSLNWTRDDRIEGFSRLYPLYTKCDETWQFDATLYDQQKASRIVASSIEKFQRVMRDVPDAVVAQQAMDSLRFQLALYRVRQTYVTGSFNYFAWLDSRGTSDDSRTAAICAFQQWQRDWDHFNTNIPRLKWGPSLYRSHGMVEDVQYAMSVLLNPPEGGVHPQHALRGGSQRP
ncbi:MAG: hypothetical protein AUJ92_09500 [Armatimonadetes bacterium CG2_30_59_28]|nr:MAG: hypothetical protein AUJ92_09500 [Armatimonadetes bacterium CG2_30_59_28]